MKPDESRASEERWTEQLAAFDDALAAREKSDPLTTTDIPSDLQPELKQVMAYARRVRQALGRPVVPVDATPPTKNSISELGRFDLLDVVGSGGFGTVYKARDRQLQRVVAIKVPRAGRLVNAEDLDRFLREARSVAQLRHPGIVPIHEVGQQEGMPYLVSEFVHGTTLAELIVSRLPPSQQAAQLVAAVADALHYAHEHGVVHRDVKPSNVLIDEAGTPHLMDFGLARREAIDATMTFDGQVLGTPAYMSPEQARGEGHQVDRCADVYSLGVVFYQLLTGELPFRGSARALLNQVVHDEPPSLRSFNDQVPRDLETICLKAMAKRPARRYQTAAAMADDLRSFLSGQAITARPVGEMTQLWRWCKRNPGRATLVFMFAGSLAAGTVISTWLTFAALREQNVAMAQAQQANRDADDARQKAGQARDEKDQAQSEARKTWRLLNVAQTSVMADAWERKDVAAVLESLETLRPGPGQEDLRGVEWHKFWRLTHSYRLAIGGPTASASSVQFLSVGKTLATAARGQVQLWDLATGREKTAPAVDASLSYRLCSMRDGTLLVLGWNDSTKKIHVFKLAAGVLIARAEVSDVAGPMEVSFDGTMLAVSRGSHLDVWDLATASKRFVSRELEAIGCQPAFSPVTKTLAVGTNAGKVKVFDLGAGQELTTLTGHTSFVAAAAFSSDGRLLATGSGDSTVALWDVATWKPFRLKHQGAVHAVRFSPDDKFLAAAEQAAVKLWNVSDRKVIATLYGHTARITSLVFSPDGKFLASASDDKTVKVWDMPLQGKGAGAFVETEGSP